MLGWEMSPRQLGVRRPGTESSIRNLHFVGHWVRPGGGITPVIVSAADVARRITRSTEAMYADVTARPLTFEHLESASTQAVLAG